MRWLFEYYWGLLLVALPVMFFTVFPLCFFYLGSPDGGETGWKASPLEVVFGRFVFAFVPTFLLMLVMTTVAFLVRRFIMKDNTNSTIICFVKSLLLLSLMILLMIAILLTLEYSSAGYLV